MGTGRKRESDFQKETIERIKQIFPECIVLKNDSGYLQGVPDILVLYKNKWATLEFKRHTSSKRQSNQDYYISKMNEMSFSRFIYPENQKEVLDELQQAFRD